MQNPLSPFLQNPSDVMILDGAFATQLEAKGYDLNDALWSAKYLLEDETALKMVHKDYLEAGATCLITASYQASFEGFIKRGLTAVQAHKVLQRAVSLAKEVRDAYWQETKIPLQKHKPLVAASIGPYGAFLANGAEYTGEYDLDEQGLRAFHKKRFDCLVQAKPELLACETLPRLSEAKALLKLLEKYPSMGAWFSFSAKDETHINSGESIQECAEVLEAHEQVLAIGINCTAPEHVSSLIQKIKTVSQKPIIVYPNSGEQYDACKKEWLKKRLCRSFQDYSQEWYQEGARLLGGCCRTTPEDIYKLALWSNSL